MVPNTKSYSIRLEKNILQGKVQPKTIIIYSTDKDFSASLSMVLQDFYNVLTTNDIDDVDGYINTHNAHLLIADIAPTSDARRCFEELKNAHKRLRIIMIYVPQLVGKKATNDFRNIVDIFFHKPIELNELIDSISTVV